MMRIFHCVFSLLITATASYIDDFDDELSSVSLVHGPNFNYTCLGGPLNWYGLDMKHNALCASGRYQSPINIDSNIHIGAGGIGMQIPPIDTAHFENLGSTVEVALSQGRLFTPTGRYALKQFHFHTPSEHRINEEYYPLEVHFVFKDPGKHPIAIFRFSLTIIDTFWC
jgi:carbonic anhydrase